MLHRRHPRGDARPARADDPGHRAERASATLQQAPRLRIEVPPTATSANIVAELKGMRLEEIGRHRIEMRAGDEVLGSSPFTVNLILRQQPGNA